MTPIQSSNIIPVIFYQCFDSIMNIGVWIPIQKCDNPKSNIRIFLAFSFKFFLWRKIVTPEIICWFPQGHYILFVNFFYNHHIKSGQFSCLSTLKWFYRSRFERFKDSKKEVMDMCMYCKNSTTVNSTTTHVVNYKNCIIVIKNVPCLECEQCGEKYYTDEVAERLETIVNMAKKLMQQPVRSPAQISSILIVRKKV